MMVSPFLPQANDYVVPVGWAYNDAVSGAQAPKLMENQ
jgi:hypothetical protein